MGAVLERYEQHMVDKGNKRKSIDLTLWRLRRWHDVTVPVDDVTPGQVRRAYRDRCATLAVDSHRNELAEVKTFWRWARARGYVTSSPAERVEPVGRRHKGKPQLRRSEARAFFAKAFELAHRGDEGAVAALTVLLLGVRSEEIRVRRVRDVDAGQDGVLLWIDEGKTDSASRYLEAPQVLAEHLVRQTAGRAPGDWLFPSVKSASGHREKTWVLKCVKRICRAAGVPVVCVHGLRGTWATLTTDAGVSAHVVARELGHSDPAVTREHYTAPGADERARARRMLQVVEGGKA